MKLYKSTLKDSECCHVKADLSDIRAAAKEMGYAVVPIGHMQSWQNYLSTAVEETEAARDWVSDYVSKWEHGE